MIGLRHRRTGRGRIPHGWPRQATRSALFSATPRFMRSRAARMDRSKQRRVQPWSSALGRSSWPLESGSSPWASTALSGASDATHQSLRRQRDDFGSQAEYTTRLIDQCRAGLPGAAARTVGTSVRCSLIFGWFMSGGDTPDYRPKISVRCRSILRRPSRRLLRLW